MKICNKNKTQFKCVNTLRSTQRNIVFSNKIKKETNNQT